MGIKWRLGDDEWNVPFHAKHWLRKARSFAKAIESNPSGLSQIKKGSHFDCPFFFLNWKTLLLHEHGIDAIAIFFQ